MRVTLFHRWNWSAVCPFDLPCELSRVRSGLLPASWTFTPICTPVITAREKN
ncbi:MAG: hypothetical protein NTZ32_24765 [Planctomycetales bacterium]|nr:hypothetical protein [Planctomycetales bacterium]